MPEYACVKFDLHLRTNTIQLIKSLPCYQLIWVAAKMLQHHSGRLQMNFECVGFSNDLQQLSECVFASGPCLNAAGNRTHDLEHGSVPQPQRCHELTCCMAYLPLID
uniref:Uncharacterized protein n=1 Tax=Rhipicephalus zambeziensis TaxID=60191 RepID=A0A224YC19_9ACAR